MSYAGTTVEARACWPVHDVTAEPHTCIRYARQAVYLGDRAAYADMAWYAHWPGRRRVKQHRGGHTETYGGKMLDIDLNVVNAPVATLK